MTITSPIHSFFRALTARSRTASHPEALQERHLNIPRRIDDPATAARLARELLHSRREDITLALYMDDRHHFVGHAIVAAGWVQAARHSAKQVIVGAQASRATGLCNHPLPLLRAPQRRRSRAKLSVQLLVHAGTTCSPWSIIW
jgi:hypothetical protein